MGDSDCHIRETSPAVFRAGEDPGVRLPPAASVGRNFPARRAWAAGLLAGAALLVGAGGAQAQTTNPDGSGTVWTGTLTVGQAWYDTTHVGYFAGFYGRLTPTDWFTWGDNTFSTGGIGIESQFLCDGGVMLVLRGTTGDTWRSAEARWVLHIDSHTFDFADLDYRTAATIEWCGVTADELGWEVGDTSRVKITRKPGTPITVPDGHPEVWLADIQPGSHLLEKGWTTGTSGDTYGLLSGPSSFEYKGARYEVDRIYTNQLGNAYLSLRSGSGDDLADSNLTLHVGSQTLSMSNGYGGANLVLWLGTSVTWPDVGVNVGLSTSEPGPPGNLSATTASDTSVTLGWSAPEKVGGSAITGYEFRRSADGGENWGSWTSIANSASSIGHLVNGLHADTAYTFQMRAVNGSGSGLHSGTAGQGIPASGPTVQSVVLSDPGSDGVGYGIGKAVSVTVTFTDAVDVTGLPRLDIDVDGSPKPLSYSSGTGTAALVFTGYTVAENDADADGIEIAANELELNGGQIRKKGSTTVNASITHDAVAAQPDHRVDGVRPALITSGDDVPKTSVDGATIALTYSETLSAITAPPNWFTVEVDGTARTVSSVSASGKVVTLTLASAVTGGQAVTVSYLDPLGRHHNHANAVQDVAGNDADSPGTQTVTNNVPVPLSVSSVVLSDAGADGTYAIGDSVSVTVTFSDSVDVTGTPQLDIDVDGSPETLGYDSGTGTDSLLFKGYVVAENDADDDGIEIAEDALGLNGGTIRLKRSTTVDAIITHSAVDAEADQRVDGVRPALESMALSTDGTKVVLTFSEELSAATAAAGAFTVEVADTARTVTVSASGATVTLTLAITVADGQTVTVAYADPSANNDGNAVQDLAGNDAATIDAQTVTETVDLAPPTFVSAATSADGRKVQLTFSEPLSATTAPTSAFTVRVNGSPRGVSSVFAGGLFAARPTVTLVLASAVATGEAVTVAYADPSTDDDANAVQDAAGNDAATFSAQTVTNNARAAVAPRARSFGPPT